MVSWPDCNAVAGIQSTEQHLLPRPRQTGVGWLAVEDARDHLFDLLSEIGRTYVPALIANASAIVNGDNQMRATIDGKPWEQPAFTYQAKCLQWIRGEFAALSPEDQATVLEIIEGTGCESLVS